MQIASVVEGHGEVQALPVLLRRLCAHCAPATPVVVLRPIRIPKSKILKADELERATRLASLQTGEGDGILILIDADEQCPAELGPALLARARGAAPERNVFVVVAKAEYEAWFLAGAVSLRGQRDLPEDLQPPNRPEEIVDAKGWLTRQMPLGRSYRETIDQPALSSALSLELARSAPSFENLYRKVRTLLASD